LRRQLTCAPDEALGWGPLEEEVVDAERAWWVMGLGAEGIERLRAVADPSRAEQEKRYLKSDLVHLGASMPKIHSVATSIAREHPAMSHDELVGVVEELWDTGIHEGRMLAVELLERFTQRLSASDAFIVEQMIREARTWALVDPLAIVVAGSLIERHAELSPMLDRWAADHDMWIRRAALLALLVPLRRGHGDFARFSRYADDMLDSKEFFIRKAIGWVLRETAKQRPTLVSVWLHPRISRLSGVTVKEAVKYLPERDRAELLAQRV
jgi:3-methyladenine DNA glycosylase AlkD